MSASRAEDWQAVRPRERGPEALPAAGHTGG